MPVPTTTSIGPSIVSGLPARPIAAMRPSRIPIAALRTPSSGSTTTTFGITKSHVPVTAFAISPSRPVLPNPTSSSSPGSVASSSTRITSPESPSRIRSPAVGP